MHLLKKPDIQKHEDCYPSRVCDKPSMHARLDPIVYGSTVPVPTELNLSQIEFYETHGFLFINSFFTPEEILLFQSEATMLSKNREILSREEAIAEKNHENDSNSVLRSLFRIHANNPVFSRLAKDQRLIDIAQQILGSEVYIHQSRINFKPGLSGKSFFWHSDFETWHVEDGMPRMRALSISIALTDNTIVNGPLMVIPGSHKVYVACVGESPQNHYLRSLKQQEFGIPDNNSIRFLESRSGIKPLLGEAGSILIFDSNLMHGSGGNISPYARSNLFFVYNSIENRLFRPFCNNNPRPEFLATRTNVQPLKPGKTGCGNQ